MPASALTIASVIRNGIANGAATEEILAAVRATFPLANTTPACVSYYRSEARRNARLAGTEPIPFGPAAVVTRQARRRNTRVIALETAFDATTGLTERPFGIEFEFKRDRGSINARSMTLEYFGEAVKRALAPWPDALVNVRHGYFRSAGRTWDVKVDGSCEYEVATPKLTKSDWPKVVAVLKALREAGAVIDTSCGVHVHHETRGMRTSHLRNLLRLWGAFDIPLHESLPESRRDNRYAYRIDETTANTIARMDARSIRREIRARDRYVALNLLNWWRHGRIEVRSHHGTLDADKVGYWLQATQAIVERAQEGRIGRTLDGIVDAADRFGRFARVVGETAAQAFARWAEDRNPTYFATVTA